MNKKVFGALFLAALASAVLLTFSGGNGDKNNTGFIARAYYSCKDGKQITADYYKGILNTPLPGGVPVPSGRVELSLSDGRRVALSQTISGSGIRYATENESFVFWSKGETAFINENNAETFTACQERIWTLGNEQADRAVRDYLLSVKELSWQTEEGSKNFCVFQNLYPEKELFPHYLWVRCGGYKKVNGEIKELSGVSIPVKIDYPNELSYYDTGKFSITMPGDGSLYDRDVKKIFPAEILDRLHFESAPLNEKIWAEVREYFK